jgi:hypothetical protein
MNKRSVKKPTVKTGHHPAARKSRSTRKARNTVAPRAQTKPEIVPTAAVAGGTTSHAVTAASHTAAIPAHAVVPRSAVLRAHKFQVGQTVLFTSSPITRPGATGTYKVVSLLPSEGDDYQYRIKNSGEAFERVAKESQLEGER